MSYKYTAPEEQGYKKFKVSKQTHNSILKNWKTRWIHRYEYYIREDSVLVHQYTSVPAIVLNFLLLPVAMVVYGLSNYKDIWKDHMSYLNEKKYGKFVSEGIWRSHSPDVYEKFYQEALK